MASLASAPQDHGETWSGQQDSHSRDESRRILRQASERMRTKQQEDKLRESLRLEEFTELETSASLIRIPELRSGKVPVPYVKSKEGVAHADLGGSRIEGERSFSGASRRIEDPFGRKKNEVRTKADAGPDWFNLPKTNLTPELKRDFQLLKMRGVLESKRFYKKESSKAAVPTFSQVGTVIEGPAEQFSSRLPKKEQKNTLLEQILADSTATKRFKKGYNDIQKSKTSGKKAFYKKLKEKRSRGVNKR